MPLIKLHTATELPVEQRESLALSLSKIAAHELNKPEKYVMVTLCQGLTCMAGTTDPAALVEIRSIGGLTPEVNRTLSQAFCTLLSRELNLPSDRIYLNFFDINRSDWGWDGHTFG